jgi:hypothetical protein
MHVNLLLITLVEKPLTMAAAGNRFLAVMAAAAAAAGGWRQQLPGCVWRILQRSWSSRNRILKIQGKPGTQKSHFSGIASVVFTLCALLIIRLAACWQPYSTAGGECLGQERGKNLNFIRFFGAQNKYRVVVLVIVAWLIVKNPWGYS